MISRRGLLIGGGLILSGCDHVNESPAFRELLFGTEKLTMAGQRLVTDRHALAREFGAADLSPVFRANGTMRPGSDLYRRLVDGNFADYRLRIDGLVRRPMALSLDQLRRAPARTQITRHDCVEGWSAIGKWTGARLAPLLNSAGLLPAARYLVFHCADDFSGTPYYESVDLIDALHPQTILAYAMNDAQLPVANGAPLRLRVERQLGYKHAKYVMRIEAVDRLDRIGLGKGGFWEDRAGYEWYAGI
ncbi:molybdopterin-binding protein [Sphingoaurantiacus capsulatus]|uniref:Molybdopterin-binding protein n=1 Tax=Sphingoaurantiacus capsulatus TaxID=1771310 RepID=A0ABV7X8E8_9SPHN